MLKRIFGIAPKQEEDGSYSPSRLGLRIGTVSKTNYSEPGYQPYRGKTSRILILFTEQKHMKMKNGKRFSTGNHPVESLVPMLHLQQAGFTFDIVTPSGKPVVFEMWAFPNQDTAVKDIYQQYEEEFEKPHDLRNHIDVFKNHLNEYAAVFIPGGHGAMLGLPENEQVGNVLHLAFEHNKCILSICHGPAALLATTLDDKEFLFSGYQMAVFPDEVDRQSPIIGYLPGHMPWKLNEALRQYGVEIVNSKSDETVCQDRNLITGASPTAANAFGILAATTLLKTLSS